MTILDQPLSPDGAGTPTSRTDEPPPQVILSADGSPLAASEPMLVVDSEEAAAEAAADESQPFGQPGPPVNRRSPFFIGMIGAAGVAVTYCLLQLVAAAQTILILVGLSLFIAIGLEPAVAWFTRRGLPRWVGVVVSALGMVGVLGGFLALAIPVFTQQVQQFARNTPGYVGEMQDHSSFIGQLNDQFHLADRLTALTKGDVLSTGLLDAGKFVLSATVSTVTVIALTLYFLAGLPGIKRTIYRCVPATRRARTILLTEDALAKVGAYVLGNVLISLIAGGGTLIWLLIFHVPYALLLAVFVAIMDLIPIVGSTVGGVVVSLVALTVSLPVALATVGFYIAYRLAEDYLLFPRIMGKAVNVPGVVSLVALLLGGTLLGVLGALIAIPIAAALRLVVEEVFFPRLDRS